MLRPSFSSAPGRRTHALSASSHATKATYSSTLRVRQVVFVIGYAPAPPAPAQALPVSNLIDRAVLGPIRSRVVKMRTLMKVDARERQALALAEMHRFKRLLRGHAETCCHSAVWR